MGAREKKAESEVVAAFSGGVQLSAGGAGGGHQALELSFCGALICFFLFRWCFFLFRWRCFGVSCLMQRLEVEGYTRQNHI